MRIVVGVIGGNEVDCNDEIHEGISLNWESHLEECQEEDHDSCDVCDSGDDTILFGDWKKDKNGLYEPDTSGKHGYAATFLQNSNTITVDWSKYVSPCGPTSPCYRMGDTGEPCGDLTNTGSSVLAFTLPPEYFEPRGWEDDAEKAKLAKLKARITANEPNKDLIKKAAILVGLGDSESVDERLRLKLIAQLQRNGNMAEVFHVSRMDTQAIHDLMIELGV